MLKMSQVHVIRHKVLIENHSISQVASDLGISRNTVSKYLAQAEPSRKVSSPRPAPLRDRVSARIKELIDEWTPRTTPKQRITGSLLHHQLLNEGFQVGKTTVYDIFRRIRLSKAEVFIPLLYNPGDVAQVDFFEVTVIINSVAKKVWKFLMRLMFSGYDFTWLYERCDQLSFLDAHCRAFAHLGGVPNRLVYDNLTAAVRRRAGLHTPERQLTERFSALASHYLFEPCFARVGEGHDKGGVESRGRAIRLQHLTPIPEGNSLQEIANRLLSDIKDQAERKLNREGRTVAECFEEERLSLTGLPDRAFDARSLRHLTASSSSTVHIEGATYSVPSRWARLDLKAYVGVDDIRLVCQAEEVLYKRQPSGTKVVRYRHYLPELAKKPQACRQVADQLTQELGEPFGRLWQLLVEAHGGLEAGRILARIVGAIDRQGEEALREALWKLLENHPQALRQSQEPITQASRLVLQIQVPEALKPYEVERAAATDYDYLLVGADT
jgi:transposase